MPGFNDSYVSTPDIADLDDTTDIELRIDIEPTTWRPTDGFGLARKYVLTSDQRTCALWLNEAGTISFAWSPDGTLARRITAVSTVADRKSVVSRKSVSVRIDLGGRRNIQTKQ